MSSLLPPYILPHIFIITNLFRNRRPRLIRIPLVPISIVIVGPVTLLAHRKPALIVLRSPANNETLDLTTSPPLPPQL